MKIVVSGIKEMIKDIQSKVINKSKIREMNMQRALAFKNYIQVQIMANRIELENIHEATAVISKNQGKSGEHPPIYDTGRVLENMVARNDGFDGIAGYENNGKKYPDNKKITYYGIVSLMHTGFRIPLQGKKGKNVRKFLAAHGIFPSKNKEYLEVKPRPFLVKGFQAYMETNEDAQIVNTYIKEIIK